MKILVTGGAGYIGSHTVIDLLENGYEVVVIDRLSNSSREALVRVEGITGKKVPFYVADVRQEESLNTIFSEHTIDAVIHFAALKAVGESVAQPLLYYENNVGSTISLLKVMQKHGVKKLVYSSSACVYGAPEANPVLETAPLRPENPYGRTKVINESLLKDMADAKEGWNITALRYFNPIGAHVSGRIGDDPHGIPNNLLSYLEQVVVGKRPDIKIFGNDYRTPDGTCIRDYIHVSDLAAAHVAALRHLDHPDLYKAYNISTGKGSSVLDIIHAYEKAVGKEIPHAFAPRRAGDVDEYYGDPSLAKQELGWEAQCGIDRGCEDSWRWRSQNHNGYAA